MRGLVLQATTPDTAAVREPGAFRPACEAALAGTTAASLAALLLWLGPPGTDLPAHLYQRMFFLEHGFVLWNNFWYSGRYSFVTYSLLYYPLSGLLGIKVLAVASIAAAALGFALLVARQWGRPARLSSRTFAVLWPGTVLSATFPFALGAALALLGLCSLQRGRRWRFAALGALTLAASPLAFGFLAVVLAGIGVARYGRLLRPGLPVAVVCGGVLTEAALLRLFPGESRYPFRVADLLPALAFAALGVLATRRLERARLLAGVFAVYGLASLAAFAVPSELGGNMARLRYAAVPLALLAVSLRGWRPLRLALPLAALACVWNLGALAGNFQRSASDPAARSDYWQPGVAFLRARLSPDYRVEAVDTAGHWAAVHLPEAGIPLVRGWYRQDDFPANAILYAQYGARAYRAWLQRLGVRYVVLTDAPPDYSAVAEAALLRSGNSGLRLAYRSAHVTVFAVPRPRPLVTGPGRARVVRLWPTHLLTDLGAAGTYRVAVRYSPYWRAAGACVSRGADGMLRLTAFHSGVVDLDFKVDAHRALEVLTGLGPGSVCSG